MDRKVVLVDLDNVVYPWAEVMAMLVTMEGLSNNMPAELIQLYKSWEVWEDWDIPESAFNRVWERAIISGDMWGVGDRIQARPIQRAAKALWKLSDQEWHIHLVTHRLNKFRLHDQVVKNTAEWLEWTNIPYRGLTFTEDKHSILGDAIVDDNPRNLAGHSAPIKLLYPAPHNRAAWENDEIPGGIQVLFEDESLFPWDEVPLILGDGKKKEQQ